MWFLFITGIVVAFLLGLKLKQMVVWTKDVRFRAARERVWNAGYGVLNQEELDEYQALRNQAKTRKSDYRQELVDEWLAPARPNGK